MNDIDYSALANITGRMREIFQDIEQALQKYADEKGLTAEEMAQLFWRVDSHDHVDGRLKLTWQIYTKVDGKDHLFAETSLTI